MKRRILVGILALTLVLSAVGTGWAMPYSEDGGFPSVRDVSDSFRIRIDGRTCAAGPVLLKHDRIYLQLRAFSECLGATVQWFASSGTAWVSLNGFGKPPVTVKFHPLNGSPIMELQELGSVMPTRFNMGTEAPFVWYDDHTYLPFRWLTDAADYKTTYAPGQPNEVNVYREQHAIPADGYLISSRHVIVEEEAREPFRLATEPQSGWPFSPATWRNLKASFLHTNWAIQRIRRDPEARAEINFDSHKVRIDVRAYNTVDPEHITFYGTHFIRWFDNEDQVSIFKQNLNIINIGEGLVSTGITTAGTAGAAYLLGASIAPLAVPIGTFTMAAFIAENQIEVGAVNTCLERANNKENLEKHKPGEPLLGLLDGPQGVICLPYYQDAALDAKGFPIQW